MMHKMEEMMTLEDLYQKIINNEINQDEFIEILTDWIQEIIKEEIDKKELKESEERIENNIDSEDETEEDNEIEELNEEDKEKETEEEKEMSIKNKLKKIKLSSNIIKWVKIYDIKDYYHAATGEKISYNDLIESIENFNKVHFKSVPINIEHNDNYIIGRAYDFRIEGNTLKTLIEVPKKYLQKYKYFSIEIEEIRDINTGEKIGKVITGLALTNKPAILSYSTFSVKAGLLPKEIVLSYYKKPKYLSLLTRITNKEVINREKEELNEWKEIFKQEFKKKGLIK